MDIVLCSHGVCFIRATSACMNCCQQYCDYHIKKHTVKGGIVCTCFLIPKEEIDESRHNETSMPI